MSFISYLVLLSTLSVAKIPKVKRILRAGNVLEPWCTSSGLLQAAITDSDPAIGGLSSWERVNEGWRRGEMESIDLEASLRKEMMEIVVDLRVEKPVILID